MTLCRYETDRRFEASNPLDTGDKSLQSSSNGVSEVETDPVNCDRAEEVGASIM
jgi:hypothetical protein